MRSSYSTHAPSLNNELICRILRGQCLKPEPVPSPGRYECLSTALKITQQQWRAAVNSVFIGKITLSICTNSLFRSLCFFVPDFGEKFLMQDAFISLSLRPNPWEKRLPQNTINVFPKPQKSCSTKLKMDVYTGKGCVQFTEGLTWVDCGREPGVTAWKCITPQSRFPESLKNKMLNLWNLRRKKNSLCIRFSSFNPSIFKPHHRHNLNADGLVPVAFLIRVWVRPSVCALSVWPIEVNKLWKTLNGS